MRSHHVTFDPVSARYRRYRRSILGAALAFAALLLCAIAIFLWESRERALQSAETEARNLSVSLSELMALTTEMFIHRERN